VATRVGELSMLNDIAMELINQTLNVNDKLFIWHTYMATSIKCQNDHIDNVVLNNEELLVEIDSKTTFASWCRIYNKIESTLVKIDKRSATIWQSGKLIMTKWQNDKVALWQSGKMTS
jgi:hypothetical protein